MKKLAGIHIESANSFLGEILYGLVLDGVAGGVRFCCRQRGGCRHTLVALRDGGSFVAFAKVAGFLTALALGSVQPDYGGGPTDVPAHGRRSRP